MNILMKAKQPSQRTAWCLWMEENGEGMEEINSENQVFVGHCRSS